MVPRTMNRRLFIKRSMLRLFGVTLLSIPGVKAGYRYAMASTEAEERRARAGEMSLRRIAEDKRHHGDGCFVNPFSSSRHGNIWRLMKWKLFSKNEFKKYYRLEKVKPVHLDWSDGDGEGCSVTFIKHASVGIRDNGTFLLIDPVFNGLFLFDDFSPIVKGMEDMPRPDYILITHGHYDHMDTATLKKYHEGARVVTPLGYNAVFDDMPSLKRTQLDWYQGYRSGGREFILLPCNHWTMRNPVVGPNRSLWGSFLVKCQSGPVIFIGGDAAYFDHYKDIGNEFSIDLAIFYLGAYEPRWFMAGSHMNPVETVKAFKELKAKYMLVVHWGAFRLGDEPVHFPPMEIAKEMKKCGLLHRLVQLEPGETHVFSENFKGNIEYHE